MIKIITITFVLLIISFNIKLLAQDVGVQIVHQGTYGIKNNPNEVLNLFATQSGEFILLKDSIVGMENANNMSFTEYINVWQTRNEISEGSNFYYMSSSFIEKEVPEATLNKYTSFENLEDEKIGYKLKTNLMRQILIVDGARLVLDPIVYECVDPKDEHPHIGELHRGENKEELKRKHKCTTFRII